MSKVDIYDSRNFLLIRILNIVYKKFGYKFENDDKGDFLYIASIKLNVDLKKVTNTGFDHRQNPDLDINFEIQQIKNWIYIELDHLNDFE